MNTSLNNVIEEGNKNSVSKVIANQTEILLKNINIAIKNADLESELDDLNTSRFLFHTLHSLDKWFINPASYKYDANSSGGISECLSVTASSELDFSPAVGTVIPRKNLEKYGTFVTEKIREYVKNLTDDKLCEKPEGCKFSRLELILGQFRHVMCHVGILSAMNAQCGSGWLEYFGLE